MAESGACQEVIEEYERLMARCPPRGEYNKWKRRKLREYAGTGCERLIASFTYGCDEDSSRGGAVPDLVMPGEPDSVKPYTLAELIYVGVYQESPAEAHRLMYRMLEDFLLGTGVSPVSKRAIFYPITSPAILSRVMEHFFGNIDRATAEAACRALQRALPILEHLLGAGVGPVYRRFCPASVPYNHGPAQR